MKCSLILSQISTQIEETVVEKFSLETWSRENLQIVYTEENKLYIERIFKSLINFEAKILNQKFFLVSKKKKLHFLSLYQS